MEKLSSCVDQQLIVRQLTERIDRTTYPRHRAMLERIREHASAELVGDLQGLMGTLSEQPAYHFWGPDGDWGPKGRNGVEAFYSNFVASGQQFLEVDCERIVVDNDCIVLEAVLKAIVPGAVMAENPLAASLNVEPDRHYLMTTRNVTFWPFDADLMLIGEDSYSGGPTSVRVLEDEELPEGYKALFATPSA